MSEAYASFLKLPKDYSTDFLWTCTETCIGSSHPMRRLSTIVVAIFSYCRVICIQRKPVFEENPMNGTNVQNKAEMKLSPRKRKKVRKAA